MTSPFAEALGADFTRLPPAVQALHAGPGRWAGEAEVTRGSHPLARLGLALGHFPPAGRGPVTLEIAPEGQGEAWTRRFGTHEMRSHIAPGPVETIGAITVALRLTADPEGISIAIDSTRAFGLPIPGWLAPRSFSHEGVDAQGRFTFDIGARLPGGALLIRYTGWLAPA
ncbi:DUF4166 domain-containing protein [Vannielia sp. SX4]|uniref:DUF4166 domain-containing protein n=1 Tax=Vannielia sp. SX4 TaxID=3463852 RepID=UPI0040593438